MKLLKSLVVTMIVLVVIPAMAQPDESIAVSFNGFSFRVAPELATNVNISQVQGDPVDGAEPGFSDASKMQFILYEPGQIDEGLYDTGGILVYRMQDLAQYGFLLNEVERLQALLDQRPDLNHFSGASFAPGAGLPHIPVLAHRQVFTARATYVDTPMMVGISYLTEVSAAIEPLGGSFFFYTFQGISTDGDFYVTVTFMLDTDLFAVQDEVDPTAFQVEWQSYLAESIATLNEAEPSDFVPSLNLLDDLIHSFTFESQRGA